MVRPAAFRMPASSMVRGRGVALAERRFTLWLFQAFAALAIAFAGFCIYGLLVYIVRQRRKELGIRMALGATRSRVLSTVVRDGLILTALEPSVCTVLHSGTIE